MMFFKKHKRAVSHVMGYIMMLGLISATTVSIMFITTGIVNNRTETAAHLLAKDIANSVADAVVRTISARRSLYDTGYETVLDVPKDLAGRKYYVEISEEKVTVESYDGDISESSTTFNAEEFEYDISGSVNPENGKLKVSCEKTEDAYLFDLGTDVSEVEYKYRRVSENTLYDQSEGDEWWDEGYYNRIPITIHNDVSDYEAQNKLTAQDLTDFELIIKLYPNNFDYSKINENFDPKKSNDGDICFTDKIVDNNPNGESDENLLPYWIETWDPNGISKIWVKLTNKENPGAPYVEAGQTKTIYMYYGLSEAGSDQNQSDPQDVFEFYDDFTDYDNNDDLKDKYSANNYNPISFDADNDILKIYPDDNIDGTSLMCKHVLFNKQLNIVDPIPPNDGSFITYTNYNVEAKIKIDHPETGPPIDPNAYDDGTDMDACIFANAKPYNLGFCGLDPSTRILMSDGTEKQISTIDEVELIKYATFSGVFDSYEPTGISPTASTIEDFLVITKEQYLSASEQMEDLFPLLPLSGLKNLIQITADGETILASKSQKFYIQGIHKNTGVEKNLFCPSDYLINGFPDSWPINENDYDLKIWMYDPFSPIKFTAKDFSVTTAELPDETIIFTTNEIPRGERPGPYDYSCIANGFLTQPIGRFDVEGYVFDSSYYLASRSSGLDPDDNSFVMYKTHELNPTEECGKGKFYMDDNWNIMRYGVFIGRSYDITGNDFSKKVPYLVFGGARFNCDPITGLTSGLDCILYDYDPVAAKPVNFGDETNIYDIDETLLGDVDFEHVSGKPYEFGFFGIGAGYNGLSEDTYDILNPHSAPWLEVDWIRVYQSLMYNLQVDIDGYSDEESLLYGWEENTGLESGKTILPSENILLDDMVSSSIDNKVFKVGGLDLNEDYTITVRCGNGDNSHGTSIIIEDNPTLSGSIEGEADEFDTLTFYLTEGTIEGETLDIEFDKSGLADWSVCAIEIEKGRKAIIME